MNKTLGLTILRARQRKGLSQREVVRLSGNRVSNCCIAWLENSKYNPQPNTLRVLCEVLELDFLKLMVMAGHLKPSEVKNIRGMGGVRG